MILPHYILKYPSFTSSHCANALESTSDTSGGASWVSRDMLRGILHSQQITSETKVSWRLEVSTLIEFRKVFYPFSSSVALFLTFRKGNDDNHLLGRAIHMDVINARSTPSRHSTNSQVAEDRRLFREALEQRDIYCIVSAFRGYQASHIIPYAHENAVSRHPIWSTNQYSRLFSGSRSLFAAAPITTMKTSRILPSMTSVMACWSTKSFIPPWSRGRLHS
jgi:hypothetical protein